MPREVLDHKPLEGIRLLGRVRLEGLRKLAKPCVVLHGLRKLANPYSTLPGYQESPWRAVGQTGAQQPEQNPFIASTSAAQYQPVSSAAPTEMAAAGQRRGSDALTVVDSFERVGVPLFRPPSEVPLPENSDVALLRAQATNRLVQGVPLHQVIKDLPESLQKEFLTLSDNLSHKNFTNHFSTTNPDLAHVSPGNERRNRFYTAASAVMAPAAVAGLMPKSVQGLVDSQLTKMQGTSSAVAKTLNTGKFMGMKAVPGLGKGMLILDGIGHATDWQDSRAFNRSPHIYASRNWTPTENGRTWYQSFFSPSATDHMNTWVKQQPKEVQNQIRQDYNRRQEEAKVRASRSPWQKLQDSMKHQSGDPSKGIYRVR